MGGNVFLRACNRHYIEAQLVLLQCLAKGSRFEFPADSEFFDPCGSAAVVDTYGLGEGQYMVYDRLVTGGVSALA